MQRIHKYFGGLGIVSFAKYLVVTDIVAAVIGYVVFKHIFLIGSMVNLVFIIMVTSLLIKYWIWCRLNY